MTIKVPNREIGIAIAVIRVALMLRKKGKITRIAKATAPNKV